MLFRSHQPNRLLKKLTSSSSSCMLLVVVDVKESVEHLFVIFDKVSSTPLDPLAFSKLNPELFKQRGPVGLCYLLLDHLDCRENARGITTLGDFGLTVIFLAV